MRVELVLLVVGAAMMSGASGFALGRWVVPLPAAPAQRCWEPDESTCREVAGQLSNGRVFKATICDERK